MSNQVIVTAQEGGAIIVQSINNPDFGYIRVEQNRTSIGNDGWVKSKHLSALIRGTVKTLKTLNYKEGQLLSGKITIIEQTEPFNNANPEKDYKIAGETGIICTIEGHPIFRNCFYTEDNSTPDVFVAHDNAADIKTKLAELKETESNNGANL
jgi:hypothetical protein